MKNNINLKTISENINKIENINDKYILIKLIQQLYINENKKTYISSIDIIKDSYNKINKKLLNKESTIPNDELYITALKYKKLLEILIKNYDKNNKNLNSNIELSTTILESILNLDITFPNKIETCISIILNKYKNKNERNKDNDKYKNIK